jgi:hypothetical protein
MGLGANNVIPAVPTFTQGDAPSITSLNNLSYAVNFLATCNVRPTWHYYKAANQTIEGTGWQYIGGGSVTAVYDNDGTCQEADFVAYIVTTGYYRVEACIAIEGSTSPLIFRTAFIWIAGNNNPHYAVNTSKLFGMRATRNSGSAGRDAVLTPSEACPVVCYPGDIIAPQVWPSATEILDYNASGGSGYESRFSCNFTGYLIRTGT